MSWKGGTLAVCFINPSIRVTAQRASSFKQRNCKCTTRLNLATCYHNQTRLASVLAAGITVAEVAYIVADALQAAPNTVVSRQNLQHFGRLSHLDQPAHKSHCNNVNVNADCLHYLNRHSKCKLWSLLLQDSVIYVPYKL